MRQTFVLGWVQDKNLIQKQDHRPSTLIRIKGPTHKVDCYQVLREAMVLKQTIDKVLNHARN